MTEKWKEKWKEERWKICQKYIRLTKTLPDAQALAAKDGVQFNTSVWITAYGKMLASREVK